MMSTTLQPGFLRNLSHGRSRVRGPIEAPEEHVLLPRAQSPSWGLAVNWATVPARETFSPSKARWPRTRSPRSFARLSARSEARKS